MKKGFHSRRLIAALMAALLSVNSLPITALAEETDLAGQSQTEAVMESDTEESNLTEESQEESALEEISKEGTEIVQKNDEESQSEEENTKVEQGEYGTCGNSVTWTLDNEGVLKISGTGWMEKDSDSEWPWYQNKENIVSVVIEEGVTTVGNSAFLGLSNLEKVEISSTVWSIERNAFANCSSLTSITIPSGVMDIESFAFSGCDSLKDIIFKGFAPSFWENSFCDVVAVIHYPENDSSWSEEVRQDYGGSLTWEPYEAEFIVDSGKCGENITWTLNRDGCLTISGTGEMESYRYSYDYPWNLRRNNILSVVIEDGITNIGGLAFYGCDNLTSIELPNSVSIIESEAFCDCSNLKEIKIPDSVNTIASQTFYNCSNLKEISIPSSITNIESSAFGGCSGLEHITFRGFSPNIDSDSFINVDAIVYYPENDISWTEDVRQNYGGTLVWKPYTAESIMYSGMCGEGVTWTLNRQGELNISGTGKMTDYGWSEISPWYFKQKYIYSVVIEEGVTNVSNSAFQELNNLTSVVIPASVKEIDFYAFEDCNNLKSVEMANGVTTIGSGAFTNCSSLVDIEIPDSVTNIGSDVFWNCTSLEKVNIPDGVMSINDNLFYGCSSLQNIQIPETVTTIGDSAFEDCSSLISIEIPENVEEIETTAFRGCSNLNTIKFIGSAPQIQDNSFENVIATVYYPANDSSWTEEIRQDYGGTLTWKTYTTADIVDSGTCGEDVTWTLDSEGLLTIGGTGDMTNYTASSECPWYSESASIVSVVVEDGVTNIGNYAFENLDNLTTATLGSSVTTIGESAFYRCASLNHVNIPDSVTTIERGAFYGCRSLESIVIPASVTTIGGSAFYGCSSLTSANIPNGITRIGWGMFYGCSGLTNITIPKNVEYIENDAFSYCSNLSEINFECSVPVIWDESFYQVTATAYYPANDSSWTEEVRKNYGGTLTWKIYGGDNVDSGTCGENVTWVLDKNGVLTISGTGEMERYASASQWPWYKKRDEVVSIVIEDGVTTIGYSAFENFIHLTNIEIPDSMTEIYWGAFENCSSLTQINIPRSVSYVGYHVFYGCSSLKAIYVEEGNNNYISMDGVLLNYKNSKITGVLYCPGVDRKEYVIPDGVITINEFAFSDCSELTSVEIPGSVGNIGMEAFSGCNNLTKITFNGFAPEFESDCFNNVTADAYYPENDSSWTEEVRQDYGGTLTWKTYSAENLVDSGSCGEDVTWTLDRSGLLSISGNGLMTDYSEENELPWYLYRRGIASAVINNGVTNIGDYAFYGCGSLTEINISDTVTEIGCNAFYGCNDLTKITIPNKVTNIGSSAFIRCRSLESIEIPSKVVSIGENAFIGCNHLNAINVAADNTNYYSIDGVLFDRSNSAIMYCPGKNKEIYSIPDGIKGIADSAFTDCEELKEINIPDSVTYIGNWAFSECRDLKNIKLSENLTYIGDYAFAYCTELTSIEIPHAVTYIGEHAFYYSSNLIEVTFNGSAPQFEEGVFRGVTATVYYPANDPSWTDEVRQDYSGTLTWVAKDSKPEEKELTIIQQPESVTGKLGETAVFTVEAEGEGVTYQWQYCNNGSSTWKNSSMMGSTTNSIDVKITKGRIGQKYRCILQDNRDNKLVSEEAQIILAEEKELAITKQPESVAGKIGETAVFKVEAEGEGVTYQWQYCNSGSSAWKNSSMTGSTTNSIEVKITKGRIGQRYRCILKDSKGNKLTTEEAQIIQAKEKKLTVIQQPESVTGKIGETTVFTVEAEGEGVTYQWQYCNSGSSAWKNSSMTGSTTNSIEVKITKGRIGQKYRCILKDSKGNKLTTEEAQIKLAEEKELAIVKQPESVTGKVGETAIFTVEAEGEGVTYQWQYCNNGSTSWANSKMTGCDTNSIEVKITKGRIGQKYRCILKDSKGNKLTTEEAQIIQAEK